MNVLFNQKLMKQYLLSFIGELTSLRRLIRFLIKVGANSNINERKN
jgi:hypothetical protein